MQFNPAQFASLFDDVEYGSVRPQRKVESIRNILTKWSIASHEPAYIGDMNDAESAGVVSLAVAWSPKPSYSNIAEQSNRNFSDYSKLLKMAAKEPLAITWTIEIKLLKLALLSVQIVFAR